MSTPFQNRIVGTVIVAAVAIIFLPDILDGKKQSYQSEFETIPETPKFEGASELKKFPEETFKDMPKRQIEVGEGAIDDQFAKESESNDVNNSEVIAAKAEKPVSFKRRSDVESIAKNTELAKPKALPEKAVPSKAWVIQLGSFRHKKNVESLVEKLKKNGYTVFTRPIKTKSGELTKVFIGPELIKSSLEKKIQPLKKLTNVEGKIALFKPTK